MRRFKKRGPLNLIYSQWKGYLDYSSDDYFGAEEIAALKDDPQVAFNYAHTSGHATLDDLKSFAQAIKPKTVVPVHTEFGEDYSDHFENVATIEDDSPFELE